MADEAVAVRRTRVGSTLLGAVKAVPVWAWLGGLVAVSTVVRFALARHSPAPWIMVDELIYSELAKSFADTGHFLVRDESSNVYSFVYPLLISPAWAVFGAVPKAYAAAKGINALLMSLAAVPAFFLARRVLSQWMALLAAVLTVAVPSMVYTGTLMTENAFYPLLLATALAIVVWLERPTVATTALVLGAALLCFLTRSQALALLPALLTAPLLVSGRRALREFRVMYGLCGVGVVLVLVVQAIRGASPLGVLGAYETANSANYTVGEVSRWFLYHVGDLDLSLGIVPFAALLLLAFTARGRPRPERAFLATSVALSFWLVLEVATFASEQSFRIEERNMFYVAPLFLIALLLWIERGAERPAAATAAALLVAAALPGAIPYEKLIGLNAVSDTVSLLPLWSLSDSGLGLGNVSAVVVAGSIAAALAFLLVPRRYVFVLPLLVLAYFAVSQQPIQVKQRQLSAGALHAGIRAPYRDWIDRTVGRDADVAVIWSGSTDRHSIWENEFFNRKVGTVYDTGTPLPGGLPETRVTADRKTGVMRDPDGKVVRSRYVLTDGSVSLLGRVLAQDYQNGILLYRIDGPLRQTTRVTGLYPQDTWSGPSVTYKRYSCRGGTLAVDLVSDSALFTKPQTVVASVQGREAARAVVQPSKLRVLRVPLEPQGLTCSVRFQVSPTAIPAVVTKGENPDPRRLGVHFSRFSYRP
jgi:Dolichyl-phosphate-mannose-protein mannosyltransferase